MYEDDIRITAQMLGVDYDSRKKRTLWHEIGHTLGLSDNVNPSQGIMDQTGYSTQADIDRSRSLVTNMMWTDIEATNVRRDYVSNID